MGVDENMPILAALAIDNGGGRRSFAFRLFRAGDEPILQSHKDLGQTLKQHAKRIGGLQVKVKQQ
ncbi:hypothetical protein [Mesorhizobium sp. M0522]|uniref:hypothetical protein n=1 Tax=Mesorhizobium sp. M0522 TaxID=2956958 RepID=UPI0033380D10